MGIIHRLAHYFGLNGCYVMGLVDGDWVVCAGCGEKRIRITRRTPEEYENIANILKSARDSAEKI